MNPLLKKHMQGGLFFLFAAVFGALFALMRFKTRIEMDISNFYFLLGRGELTYFNTNIEIGYGSSFFDAFFIFFVCLLIYAIYLFFDEKNSSVGNFIAFIPIKKSSAYFYKWICGVLLLVAAFAVAMLVTAVLLIYLKPEIEYIYQHYNGIIETYQRQNDVYYSFAGNVYTIFVYLFYLLFVSIFVYSFALFALSAFGKISHAAAFIFSVAVFIFAILFVCSTFQNFPSDVIGAPESKAVFFQPLCDAVMSLGGAVIDSLILRTEFRFVSVSALQYGMDTTYGLDFLRVTDFFIGIVIFTAGSALFFWLGKKIYCNSEISRSDKMLMTKGLKKPAIIYICLFGIMFLAMLAITGTDIASSLLANYSFGGGRFC